MRYLIFSIALLGLISCKDQKNHDHESQEHADHHQVEATHEHQGNDPTEVYDNTWTKEIKLNDGAKWEANAATNEGVEKMQNTLNKEATSTIEDYHELAADLNVDKNYVIKNCTMKGASHDNLHVWLLPLITKIDALSETKSLDEASKIKQSLKENIDAYSDYFE